MAWLAQSHLILMNTQRKGMKHQKMLCFLHNYKSVYAEGSLCFIYAHPVAVVVFFPTMLNSAATSHVIVSLCLLDVSIDLRCGVTGILLWPQADTSWIGCDQPAAENLKGWSAARGKWKKKNAVSRTTWSHALLIMHILLFGFFSICVHQAQKKNNMGLPVW